MRRATARLRKARKAGDKQTVQGSWCDSFGIGDGAPDFLRRQRQVEMFGTEGGEGIDDGIGDGGRSADGAGFADAFDSEWIAWAWRDGVTESVGRNIRGARHGIVHELTREQLTILIV